MTNDAVIGLIGVGLLGSAIAERLLGAGYRVRGFDLNQQRLRQLEALGGEAAESIEAVAGACRRVILGLPDSAAVASVANSLVDLLPPGALVIDTTTGDPDATVAVARQLGERDVNYLDATIAGSSAQARTGDIVMMVGGESAALASCRDLLDALARQVFHLGPSGSGARMKLVVNLVLGLNRAVLAEGLALARACGIDLQAALDVLRSSAAHSAVMDTKGVKMVSGDFQPQARLAQHHKDVGLILQLAARHAARLPLTSVHDELLRSAIEKGFGDADNSAIIRAFD